MRTLWFRFWVDVVSESLVWLERRTLTLGHRLRVHRFAVWLTFRESWLYHRALDLAGIGLEEPRQYRCEKCGTVEAFVEGDVDWCPMCGAQGPRVEVLS